MLEVELDKVHTFQRSKTTELARRIGQAEADVHRLVRQEEAYHASLASQANGGRARARNYSDHPDLEEQRRNAGEESSDEDVDDSDDDALGDELSSKSADTFEEQFRWLEEEVATLVADVHDLALYTKLNLTGFMKILKVSSDV